MDEDALELCVADGPQGGARLSLPAGRAVTIGSAFDDDVMLRDASLPRGALTLLPSAGGCRLDALAEGVDVDVDGEPMHAGQSRDVDLGATLRVGGTRLIIGGRALAAPAAEGGTSLETAADEVLAGTAPLVTPPWWTRHRRWTIGFAAGAVGALLLGGVALVQQRQAADVAAALAARPTLGALLVGAGFEDVRAEEGVGGSRLAGFVPARADRLRLDTLLAGAGFVPAAVARDVVVGERLAASVEDVYRLHGVEATVRALGPDAVRVETSLGDAARLARLEQAVRADVPGLGTIDVVDSPPEPARAGSTDAPGADGPLEAGKRVAMVVSGAAPHVLTEDGSRYFVGAVLPNGQRIRAISDGRVTLARGDETVEMTF